MSKSYLILYCAIFFQFVGCVSSKKEIYVKDNARILSLEFIKSLNSNITKGYEKSKVQIIVYTINSIDNIKSLDEYTIDLISKTDFGHSGFRQSVVMILYPDEGWVFMRWGESIKARIDTIEVNKVIDSMKTFFKKNDFFNGINFGVERIYALIK